MNGYLMSLSGGMLIGLSAAILMIANGRVAGISGIAGRLLQGRQSITGLAFVIGLVLGPVLHRLMAGSWPSVTIDTTPLLLLVAGLLVGFGSRMGSGCTSGHGVVGACAAVSPLDRRRCDVSRHGHRDGLCDEDSAVRHPAGLRTVSALVSGLVFGLGLSVSGMLDPVRVRNFLDVAGAWDPSLAFVLGGAVFVAAIGAFVARRMTAPAFDTQFHLPQSRSIDWRLIVGSAIFGIGWGIGGLCPGPALASLSLGLSSTMGFVCAMVVGMLLHDRFLAPTT